MAHPKTLFSFLILSVPVMKIVEFAYSIDLDVVVHSPIVFQFSMWYSLDLTFFENLHTKILFAFWLLK